MQNTLNKFFNRIAFLRGSLYHMELNITRDAKEFLENWEKSNLKKPSVALFSTLIISDITGPTDKGWGYNYQTSSDYIVDFENYKNKTYDLTIQFSHFIVAQSYEAFETYLKNILASFFSIRPEIGFEIIAKYKKQDNPFTRFFKMIGLIKLRNKDSKKMDWGQEIRKIPLGTNNEVLFKSLRSITKKICDFEVNNNKELDLKTWYKQYSIVRHSITHANGTLQKSRYNCIARRDVFDNYFPSIVDEHFCKLAIDRNHAEYICKLITEYAFQIFKFLSIEVEEDWMILKNMKNNYGA